MPERRRESSDGGHRTGAGEQATENGNRAKLSRILRLVRQPHFPCEAAIAELPVTPPEPADCPSQSFR